jgi:hypothetical protein
MGAVLYPASSKTVKAAPLPAYFLSRPAAARCADRLHASSVAVGSIAVFPTSTNAIFPSLYTT